MDGTKRLVQELSEVCWEGNHLWWSIFAGFPGLLVWGLGIPGFTWLVLRENRPQLGNLELREKYGFLYKGYKMDSFYWECVIMYRKVGMVFIAIFLEGVGTTVQALVVILNLVFFVVITHRMRPFFSHKLNYL